MSNNPTNGLKITMEFIGIFILSAAINFSTVYEDGKQIGNPLLIILAFYSAITITRSVSGGHINPAVTLAVYFEKPSEIRSKEQPLLTLYVLAQFLGAIAACLFSFVFYKENVFKLAINANNIPMNAFIIEIIATALFTYSILCQGIKIKKYLIRKIYKFT
jgi:glycerol uptake facilitator-like aquaporin